MLVFKQLSQCSNDRDVENYTGLSLEISEYALLNVYIASK